MKQLLYIVIAITISTLACKKGEGDLSGENEIKGTVYLTDSERGTNEEILQKGIKIKIKFFEENDNNNNYLFETTTNEFGAFTFTNLSDKDYLVYAEKEEKGILFSTKVKINPSIDKTPLKLILKPDTEKSNLLSILTLDSSTGGILSKVKVCLFRSSFLARTNQCNGAIKEDETNEYGKLAFSKLEAGWYYINAQYTSGGVNIRARDSILVTATGLKPLILRLKAESWQGELKLDGVTYLNDTLTGISDEKILKGQVVQLKKVEDKNNQNVLLQVTSNDQGVFSLPNLADQNYYLYAEREENGIWYTYRNEVNPRIQNNLKVVLYPDTVKHNILNIIAKDSATGGLLAATNICLFNSKLLAVQNECDGAISTKITNAQGRVSFLRLPQGWYFINAQFKMGNVDIKVKDSVFVNGTGLQQKQLFLK